MPPLKQWQFIEIADLSAGITARAWIWQALGASGDIEATCPPHRSFGSAVADAIRHGFQPAAAHWEVITPSGTTSFEPSGKPGEPRVEISQPPQSPAGGETTGN